MAMRRTDWEHAHTLAAELVVEHRTDTNQLQKVVSYLCSEEPDYAELQAWLDAKVNYANFFPRSQQTLRHDLAVRAVVQFIGERHTTQPLRIAEMLGWVVRLMRYYDRHKSEARGLVDPRRLLVYVPEAREVRLIERPPRREVVRPEDALPEVPESEKDVSDKAKDFMAFLQSKSEDEG